MRIKIIALAALLSASLATPQSSPAPDGTRTFDFTGKPTAFALQEMATILRTVGDIRTLSVDPAAATLTVGGTPDELALSAWVFHQLDEPVDPALPSSQPYLVAGKSDDVIRIFHLSHMQTPQAIQEALTVLRTVADIQKIFDYPPLTDLVIRGTAGQLALAEYLINSLDRAKGSVTTSQEFHYTSPRPANNPEVVRVFYLAHASTPQQTQEILTTLRTIVDIQKIFNFTPLQGLAIRGSASDLAAAEWMIQSLDIAAAPVSPHEFHLAVAPAGDSMIRVFYPANMTAQTQSQTLTLIRNDLHLTKVYTHNTPPALIVRGSADQIAKAELLIQEQDHPAKSTP